MHSLQRIPSGDDGCKAIRTVLQIGLCYISPNQPLMRMTQRSTEVPVYHGLLVVIQSEKRLNKVFYVIENENIYCHTQF